MITGAVKFKGHPCFKKHWSGLDEVKPITLIIGKNNTGKSHLLQFVAALCEKSLPSASWDLKLEAVLKEETIQRVFNPSHSGGTLGGNHWQNHGHLFVGKQATWYRERGIAERVEFDDDDFYISRVSPAVAEERHNQLLKIFPTLKHPIEGKQFKHLFADRDIQPEPSTNDLKLLPNGSGATNIVRRFLNSSETAYPRHLIQRDMLAALNEIFGEDGKFREITVQHHDGKDPTIVEDLWEIFLEQEHKGLVSLSGSGSGLKTIFLVLLHMIAVPVIEKKKIKNYVFAFEELENNLHPSLIRNLLRYLRSMIADSPEREIADFPQIFLTTHSSVALDFFADDELSQVIHVTHDGESAKTQTVIHSSKRLDVIWELGTRPSDLLQANGIIWVEGPSDRIYLNRWIELFSEGRLSEGRHYQCAFYGGGLLSNLQAAHEEEADDELINLLKINPNVIVVSDSDRAKKGAQLKERVRRIRDEFSSLDKQRSLHWILEAREIENYLTAEAIKAAGFTDDNVVEPTQFQSFFSRKGEEGYVGKTLKRKTLDKVKLATLTTPHMTREDLVTRFDLDSTMKKIITMIETWNR